MRDVYSAGARGHRREHDDAAKCSRPHEAERGTAAKEIARQIDLQCALPIFTRKLQERLRTINRRAADQIIDVAGSLTDGVECCVDLRFIGDIDGVKAPLRRMRWFQVEHVHGGAFIVKPPRDRAANPATAAGDDRNAAVVFPCLRHCFSIRFTPTPACDSR